jgi:hypothetical protein
MAFQALGRIRLRIQRDWMNGRAGWCRKQRNQHDTNPRMLTALAAIRAGDRLVKPVAMNEQSHTALRGSLLLKDRRNARSLEHSATRAQATQRKQLLRSN